MRATPRTRRLMSDYNVMRQLQEDSSILTFQTHGHPPEEYHVRFSGVGLMLKGKVVRPQRSHHVIIRLGANYPRVMPELRWMTPLFHPNVSASGAVCLGGYQTHWVPSLDLAELCEMLWDMVRYANFDVTSPYNREAALWTRSQREYPMPTDDRPLRDRIATQPRPVVAKSARESEGILLAEIVTEQQPARSRTRRDDPDVLFID